MLSGNYIIGSVSGWVLYCTQTENRTFLGAFLAEVSVKFLLENSLKDLFGGCYYPRNMFAHMWLLLFYFFCQKVAHLPNIFTRPQISFQFTRNLLISWMSGFYYKHTHTSACFWCWNGRLIIRSRFLLSAPDPVHHPVRFKTSLLCHWKAGENETGMWVTLIVWSIFPWLQRICTHSLEFK